MATLEKMTLKYREVHVDNCLNVSEPVGVGQPNKVGDVMVVQALFKLAAIGPYKVLLPDNGKSTPEVTGIFTERTKNFIWSFQQESINKPLAIDGIVHPASLRGRTMRMDRAQMTIVKLNMYADSAYQVTTDYSYDHTKAILEMYPMLKVLVTDLRK